MAHSAICLAAFFQDPELYHLIAIAAKAAPNLHIPNQFFLACKHQVQQSIFSFIGFTAPVPSPCWIHVHRAGRQKSKTYTCNMKIPSLAPILQFRLLVKYQPDLRASSAGFGFFCLLVITETAELPGEAARVLYSPTMAPSERKNLPHEVPLASVPTE